MYLAQQPPLAPSPIYPPLSMKPAPQIVFKYFPSHHKLMRTISDLPDPWENTLNIYPFYAPNHFIILHKDISQPPCATVRTIPTYPVSPCN